jgi:hypothetical protein
MSANEMSKEDAIASLTNWWNSLSAEQQQLFECNHYGQKPFFLTISAIQNKLKAFTGRN